MRHLIFQPGTPAAWLLLFVFVPPVIVPQELAKTLEWEDHHNINSGRIDLPWSRRIEEIELEDILIDGRAIFIGEPFVGDIRNLAFRIKNISDGPIGFVQITVTLPEVKAPPEIPFVRAGDGKTLKSLLPGEEAELRIADRKIYDWVGDTVTQQGRELKSIRKAAIRTVIIVSQKSGQLPGGCVKTRDPRNECQPRH